MENQKLTHTQLMELNQAQKKEIESLKARLAQFDAQFASPENMTKSTSGNFDRLQLAAKAAGLGYFEWFPQKNTIEWDPVMHSIFGLEPESKLDKNQYFYDVLHPDDKDRLSKDTKDSLNPNCKQLYFPAEYKIILPGGLLKHIQAYSLHFRNPNGEVIRIIGACQDISERRKSQDKARESELRYAELVEAINSAVATYKVINQGKSGSDYIILDFNKTALELEGLKKEDVVGKSLKDLRPNIDEYGLIPIFQKVWETGQAAYYPAKIYNDKNFYNYYENRVYRLPNMEIVAIYDDVTQRKEAARALSESQKLLLTIAENYPNSFITIINKDFTIGFSSGQEFKKQNLNPKNFIGLSIDEIFGEHASLVKSYYQKTFEGTEQSFELYIKEQYQVYKTVPLPDTDGKINQIMSVVENITEKRRTEIALEENEKKYRLLAENSVEVIWQMDLELKFTYVNPASFKTFGYTPNEWIGTRLSAHATRKEFFKMARQAIYILKNYKRANQMNFEANMLHKDGTEIPVEITGQIVVDDAGKPIGVQGATHNISERKKAEAAIRKSEEQFRLMFENHNAVMLLINPSNGRIVRANKSAEKFYGYTTNEITNKTIDDINVLSANEVSEYRRKALEGKINSFQFRHKLKAGTIKNVAVHSTKIVFEGTEALFSIIHDVTEKVLAEAALKQSEEKYRLLLHNQTDLIVKVDTKGCFLFASLSYCKIFGKNENELLGKQFMPLVHEDDKEQVKKKMEKLFSPPHTCVIQQRALTLNGWRWIEWIDSAVLDDNRKVKEIIGVGRDITERKKDEKRMLEINEELAAQNEEYLVLNEELTESMNRIKKMNEMLEIAKEKAQESDRLKTAFLANMSHEIRTPMNGILGFADLLKTPSLTGQQQQKYINVIEKSGVRMLNIINDLIDISKIEAGQMDVIISASNISKQIEYLYTFFKPEAQQKGLALSCVNPIKGEQAIIQTDKEKIYAVLTNLIKNAIKYTPTGSVEFGYELVQIADMPFVEFFVKDSGIGIQADRQQAIFERFIQADIEDKQVYEGAGLGLAISKAYVEMLGGKIWVESREGLGSEFHFTIPYLTAGNKKNASTELYNKDVWSIRNKNLKVMVVEDDETSKLHLSLILQDITKDVIFAKTGVEAINLYKKNPDIDLILMDIKMPEMDGYTATREIRKLNDTLVIIAQTAYALTGDREKAIEAGCNDYIAKPIHKVKLINMINQHITDR